MKMTLVLLNLVFGSLAFAHGDNKPGPHGGYIEMPGAFHTEVVPDPDGSFHIYLLDVEFKNPSTKESSVQASLASGSKKSELKCEVMEPAHFHCVPPGKTFKAKELVVTAKREKMQGNAVKYKLPLSR